MKLDGIVYARTKQLVVQLRNQINLLMKLNNNQPSYFFINEIVVIADAPLQLT